MNLDPAAQAALITGAFGVILALLEMMRRSHKTLGDVREQVQNNHTTNLRDDIDRMVAGQERVMEALEEHGRMLRGHGYELGHLRRDLQQERTERLMAVERLDAAVEQRVHTTAAVVAGLVERP